MNNKAERIFKKKKNQYNFYLHNNDFSFKKSEIYLNSAKKGYDYSAEFYICLKLIDSLSTRVSIKTINPIIIIGQTILPNFHNGGLIQNSKKVPPSTIEEYEILWVNKYLRFVFHK